MDLFDLQDGDRFEWQGRKYTLVSIDEDDEVAIVIEEAVANEQFFNPYATITKIGG